MPRPSVESVTELALDLRWAWNHSADALWELLAPDVWAATHNPWVIVQTMSKTQIATVLARTAHRKQVAAVLQHRHRHLSATGWYRNAHPEAPNIRVAYFSMEFAVSEALPIYSGGLGNVAGDQLKAACDLDVPVIGVGLLYQQGYFRQLIRPDGSQQALRPYNDPGQLPITPVRDANGAWLRVGVPLVGSTIQLRAWQVRVGRRTLYLLDSNDPANPPAARAITSELYGGDAELRLQQEIALGVGGWRLLRALRLEPDVCHLNEGHAAFAVLERARSFAEENACAFDVALAATRAGNLFTTHTAVSAGFDRFAPALVERHLGRFAEDSLGIPTRDLMALGRANPDDAAEAFSMAYLAVRGSGAINGVSQLHGAASRRLFQPLFPRWPEHEVPIRHVTNGIHVPTWDSPAADALWTRASGADRWRGTMEGVAADIRQVADADLWALRTANRAALVAYVRERTPRDLAVAGAAPDEVTAAREALDPHALTLGFARRFTAYKRPTLLLHSPDRLVRILTAPDRPVQLVIAGKAHPADTEGQAMVAEWVRFARRPEIAGRVVIIPDYDLLTGEQLVRGADVWINTPRRPWEASGTSGMKVLVNGGLNASELDGWWAEAYAPDVGWAVGDGREHPDDPAWDAAEADALYGLLEREVVPAFYTRDADGVPPAWVAKMRASMANLTPRFSANRAVREYTERYYLPAATAVHRRAANKGALARRVVAWQRHLAEHWSHARFGAVQVATEGDRHRFAAEVYLNGLDAEAVRVEVFADALDGGDPPRYAMVRGKALGDANGGFEYTANVPASRPTLDYTVRVVAHHPDAQTPLEAGYILWQR